MGREVQKPEKLARKMGTLKVEVGKVLKWEWVSAVLNTGRD